MSDAPPSHPGADPPPERRPAPVRARFPVPPLWARWVLSFGVAGLLIFGLVRFVQSNNSTAPPASDSPSSEVQANRESEILVAQDQAPHTARLRPGASPRAAITAAVRTDLEKEIDSQELEGPLGPASCSRTGSRGKLQLAFSCSVAADSLPYPFLGVVDIADRTITYCKHDPPPVPSQAIPVSPRCTL